MKSILPVDVFVNEPSRPLTQNDVHLWRLRLDTSTEKLKTFNRLLSSIEKTRAQQLRLDSERNRFVAAHGQLRSVLATYLETPPDQVEVRYNAYGKPALAGANAASGLTFNLSYSMEWALLAVGRNRNVGVDLKRVCEVPALETIVASVFTSEEASDITGSEDGQKLAAFCLCWTRKEAVIKTMGKGLHPPLSHWGIVAPVTRTSETPIVLADPRLGDRFSIWDLVPAEDYRGALSVEGTDVQLGLRTWPESQ